MTDSFFVFRYTLNGKFIYSIQEQIRTEDHAIRFAKHELSFADDIVCYKAEKVIT